MHLRLCLIQPKCANSIFIVIFFYFVPYKTSCFRMCYINKCLLSVKFKCPILPVFRAHEHVRFIHLLVVFTLWVNRWPNWYNRFNFHFFQFPAHCRRIRPILRIEFPFSLLCPVKIINNNSCYRNSSLFIFSGNFQQILLTLIPKLALPESGCPLWKLRGISRQIAIYFQHIRGSFTCINQIISLIGTICHPHRMIVCCFTPSRRRVVP